MTLQMMPFPHTCVYYCLINASACHETEIFIVPDSIPAERKLNIGVVGAGPGKWGV